jgi:hypothetical protein
VGSSGSWSTPTPVANYPLNEPPIVLDGAGKATAIVSAFDIVGNEQLQAVTAPAGSTSFGAGQSLGGGVSIRKAFLVADGAGNLLGFWGAATGFTSSNHSILGSSRWNGTSWNAVGVESDASADFIPSSLAGNASGQAVAAWIRYGSAGELHVARFTAQTGWSTPTRVSAAPYSLQAPSASVAIDPAGDAVAVWCEGTASAARIGTARYVAGSGWTAPQYLSPSVAQNVCETAVAMDAQGHAVAIWNQGPGPAPSLYVSRLH